MTDKEHIEQEWQEYCEFVQRHWGIPLNEYDRGIWEKVRGIYHDTEPKNDKS